MKILLKLGVFLLLANFSIEVFALEKQQIYLTRHAEKLDDGTRDPALSIAGRQRAKNLATFLKSKNITTIFSTDYKRTKQTAKPIADLLGISIKSYDPSALLRFAERIKSTEGNILVVGHSNTTPDLVKYLGGDPKGKIKESEYDRLYHLEVIDGKMATKILRKL